MRNKVPFFLSLVLILLLGLRCGSKEGCGDNELLGDWELIWYDEFESGIIDTSKWCYDIGGHGWGNNELQYYTDRPINSFIENGKLIIQAVKERYIKDGKEWQYTSARIKTMNRGDWKYGRIEVKAKLPYGQGIWPAIWMLPTEWKYGGWAASGEIDIMEMLGHETNKVYGWDTTYIKWFVDDSCYQVQTQWWSSGGPYPAPFDQKFHLIMNIAVGGNWPGYPDETTKFPQRMEVEYVRVYKKDNGR